ncbi:endoplasmic reticulum metallopeptidase 1 [Drosophila subobscura]|uniref:endoplasmic reticulum metallopeptidase 1 n=1 Tax=Drosophila subobscura TaxID=7241 RepID=UPI00155AA245|nr:endoplasmic reticulum metallopeptidase 1 [Drosophila subobscura]
MAFSAFDITPEKDAGESREKKWPWYGAPIYAAICFALFYVSVLPSFYSYPDMLYQRDEAQHPDEFIGERSMKQLAEYAAIGNKMSGSIANEVHTVNFLLRELQKIVDESRSDLYDIEVEKQYSSGSLFLFGSAMSYSNVSNVVVKISQKSQQNDNYLLVNSHYDSEVGTPAVSDDGVMVVIMLEALRVISRSEKPLAHPVVFLFNGAEEACMLGSHGFITQHRWAKNCKALVNLDSAGAGGREILFQTGPNHPWLAKYYHQSAAHPFANSMAEELFQNNFIPSDTDFRIFRDYGSVPGLDMAHALNGYVYHTKYDNFKNIERGTYQSTGENVLPLVWALANAPELDDTAAHEEGHTVFYDFVGWFMLTYTESVSIAINVTVCVLSLLCIGISLYLMSVDDGADALKAIFVRFGIIFLVQLGTVLAACGLTILVAVFMQAVGLSESWYYGHWMIFGLYFCTLFFVLGLLPAIYIGWTKRRTNMKLDQTISCFMHAHCIVMIVLCIIMTSMAIRSGYFPMIGVFFYTISVVVQITLKLSLKKSYFVTSHLICQVLPFIYYTYMCYAILIVFVPMQGRDGPDSSPDVLVSVFIIYMTMHFAGFLIPIMHKFRKPKTIFSIFGALTIIFIIIATTSAGFPFVKELAAQRYYVLHTSRTFHNADNTVKQDSGFYIQPVDTRLGELDDSTFKNREPSSWTEATCAAEPFCGLPIYSGRWIDWKDSARWIYSTAPQLPMNIELTQVSKASVAANKIRYEFSLRASDRVMIYVDPLAQVKVSDWSFDKTPLDEAHTPPYLMYHIYSLTDEPFDFWVELEHEESNTQGPYFKLVVSEHFLYHKEHYTEDFRTFLDTFPDWTYTTDWFSSLESWVL